VNTIQDAARLLIVHSMDAARELARRSPSSPIYQQLYNKFAGEVLGDPLIILSTEERTLIAGYIVIASEGMGRRLQVRLSQEQYAQVESDAEEADMDISAYVRQKLGL